MTTYIRPNFRRDFKIAILCALEIEFDAVEAHFDQDWEEEQLYAVSPGDSDNRYKLGRIGQHNVVLVGMQDMGKTSSASAARSVKHSFEGIKLALLVGICGGQPGIEETEVFLGDILISTGIIEYDFGRQYPDGVHRRESPHDKPNEPARSFLKQLRLEKITPRLRNRMMEFLSVRRQQEGGRYAQYPGSKNDVLYEADYHHIHRKAMFQSDCDTCRETGEACDNARKASCVDLGCETSKLVPRPREFNSGNQSTDTIDPKIHFGLIASGDSVIKSGVHRDRLANTENVIGFEMEGVGIRKIFSTIIVKGVCDYADSHKNKDWQLYAAAVAAACTKAVLAEFRSEELPSDSILSDDELYRRQIIRNPRASNNLMSRDAREKWTEIVSQVTDYNPKASHRILKDSRTADTTTWFLSHPRVKSWLEDPNACTLWCTGTVGTGKTMICTAVVDHLRTMYDQTRSPCFYFYCSSTEKNVDATSLFASLSKQIIAFVEVSTCSEKIVSRVNHTYASKLSKCTINTFIEMFELGFDGIPSAYFVIDGLDALEQQEIVTVLQRLESVFNGKTARKQKLLIASRHELGNNARVNCKYHVNITPQDTEKDMQLFIESGIIRLKEITDSEEVRNRVRERLNEQAKGMFLLVKLQIDTICQNCFSDAQILETLESLPQSLREAYQNCLQRIPVLTRHIAPRILRWVICATHSLRIDALQEAVGVNLNDREWNEKKLVTFPMLKKSCANLLVYDQVEKCMRLVHHTLKQYLCTSDPPPLPGFRIFEESGILRCGEECVKYLSFPHFSLKLQQSSKSATEIKAPQLSLLPSVILGNGVAASIVNMVNRKPPISRASKSVPLPKLVGNEEKRQQFPLLDYARRNWAVQTKSITPNSLVWKEFNLLAVDPNPIYKIQPWGSGSIQMRNSKNIHSEKTSYFHSLLSYATIKSHIPLLEIVIVAASDYRLKEFCNLPCIDTCIPPLHTAAMLGHKEVTAILLSICNVNHQTGEGATALHYAALQHNTDVVRLLLGKKGIQTSHLLTGKCPESPLGYAARSGYLDIVILLLEAGADLTPSEVSLENPIVGAACKGSLDILKRLLHQYPRRKIRKNVLNFSLWQAAAFGNDTVVQYLLEQDGININHADDRIHTPLFNAAEHGRESVVELLLAKRDIQPNLRDFEGKTQLFSAAENGHERVVKLLLAHRDVEPNSKDSEGNTPLLRAAENGYEKVVEALLVHRDIELNSKNSKGNTPLLRAAENGHEKVVKLLLAHHDVEPNSKDSEGNTPLLRAAEYGREKVVQLLLAHRDVEPNSKAFNGDTPLKKALRKQREAVARLLLERDDVVVEPVDETGVTPLMYAAVPGFEVVVKQLLERGNIQIERKHDETGMTALSAAASSGAYGVVKLLLKQADVLVNSRDSEGRTPLSLAAGNRDYALLSKTDSAEVAKQLLGRADVEVNSRDIQGRTPLSHAAENNFVEVAKLLLERGDIQVNSKDENGRTPLSWALQWRTGDIVKLLLERKDIDADSKDENGRTPLSWAMRMYGQDDVVKLLLGRKDVDVDSKDDSGKTPLSHASEANNETLVKLLEEHIEAR